MLALTDDSDNEIAMLTNTLWIVGGSPAASGEAELTNTGISKDGDREAETTVGPDMQTQQEPVAQRRTGRSRRTQSNPTNSKSLVQL